MIKTFPPTFGRLFPRLGAGATTDVSVADYRLERVYPVLVFDPAGGLVGSRHLDIVDYRKELTNPVLVMDPASKFTGASL